jgi:hypothetical protein
MKCKLPWLLPVLLLASASAFAQTEAASPPSVLVLHNADVLRMVNEGIKPGEIIARIVTSSCVFDTFPPVMKDLTRRGVPDTVLVAMKMVPYGPPAMAVARPSKNVAPARSQVQIPAGTLIEIEAAKAISSADVDKGNAIIFLVSRRVFVNGVLVIDRGAFATARAIKSQRAGSWGRGGTLEFAMENIVAVDGTRIPIQLSNEMIWAPKKGDDTVLDQGTQLTAVVKNNQQVAGLLPEKKNPIYHSVESINVESRPQQKGLDPFNNSFRATPIRQ